jgi:hypothetical protein
MLIKLQLHLKIFKVTKTIFKNFLAIQIQLKYVLQYSNQIQLELK